MSKLGKRTDQRMAMLKNQVSELLWYGQIETTVDRAKAVRSLAEKYITIAMRAYQDDVKVTKTVTNAKGVKNEVVFTNDGPKKLAARRRLMAELVDLKEVKGDRAVIDQSQDGKNAICSPTNVKFLTFDGAKVEASKVETFKSYLAKVTASALNIRKGAGTNYAVTGCIKDKGTHTIVAESAGQGSTKGWGKLNSGAGWISLDDIKKV